MLTIKLPHRPESVLGRCPSWDWNTRPTTTKVDAAVKRLPNYLVRLEAIILLPPKDE